MVAIIRSLTHYSLFSRLGIQCSFFTSSLLKHCGLFFKSWWLIVIFSKPSLLVVIILSQGGCFVAVFHEFSKSLWLFVCCICLLIMFYTFCYHVRHMNFLLSVAIQNNIHDVYKILYLCIMKIAIKA